MSLVRFALVAALVGGGFYYFKQQHSTSTFAADAVVSDQGFAALPPAEGQVANKVFVVAAQNCTREEARRADHLADALSQKGIPVQRVHRVSFNLAERPEKEVMARLSNTMKGPLPIVFINGRAKANPSLDEVVAEFGG